MSAFGTVNLDNGDEDRSALVLAGIYSVMSFTVAQRTREIGIRVTLGANPRRVVSAIFRRPLRQVGAGMVVGTLILLVPLAVQESS